MSKSNKLLHMVILILASYIFILLFCMNFLYIPMTNLRNTDIQNINHILELDIQLKSAIEQENLFQPEKIKLQFDNSDLNNQVKLLSETINNLNQQLVELSKVQSTFQSSESNKVAYLTFDDGPSEITEKILDLLKINNIKATFFVVGRTDDYSKKMYKRIVTDGHTLALHTYSHNYAEIYSSEEAFLDDLNKLKSLIVTETGVSPKYIRFAGGSSNSISKEYSQGIMTKLTKDVLDNGYKYFDWNVSSGDASPTPCSSTVIVNNIFNSINDKSQLMILMHDSNGKQAVVDALPEIIEGLRKANFIFAAIDDNTVPIVHTVIN